jgi:hypothetical protein
VLEVKEFARSEKKLDTKIQDEDDPNEGADLL